MRPASSASRRALAAALGFVLALALQACAVPLPVPEPTPIAFRSDATSPIPTPHFTASATGTRAPTRTALPTRTPALAEAPAANALAPATAPAPPPTQPPTATTILTATATAPPRPTLAPTNSPTRPPSTPATTPPTATRASPTATPRAATPTAPPVVTVTIPGATVVYYDVRGSTADQLRAHLDAIGPLDADGRRWDSVTTWRLAWRWPTTPDGGCRMDQATVSVTAEVKFPRWAPPAGAPTDLVRRWTAYVQALAAHERGHVEIATRGAAAIQSQLRGATCDTAAEVAQAQLDVINNQQEEYDLATNHGATQGAIFP